MCDNCTHRTLPDLDQLQTDAGNDSRRSVHAKIELTQATLEMTTLADSFSYDSGTSAHNETAQSCVNC